MEEAKHKKPQQARSRAFGGDAALWIIIAALAIISLLAVYSSTASMAYKRAGGDTSFYMLTHMRFLLLGFIVLFVIHRFNYQSYYRYIRILFMISLGLMAMTFFVGEDTHEAARSIRIPIINLTFQPADMLKITLVMVLAKELGKKQMEIAKLKLLPVIPINLKVSDKQREKNRAIIHDVTLPLLLPVVLACGMIFISNFSTSALVFVSCLVMLYVGRVKVRELWRLVRITVVTVVVAVAVMYPLDLGRSRIWVNRVTSFMGVENPSEMTEDEIVAREMSKNQVQNAKMAIASGRGLGRGPGHSVQRTNLPLPFSDYVYAFIAEEYGLLGAFVVLALYLWLFFRTIVIFQRCEKSFPSLLVLGLGITIVMQAFISMLVAVDLFPVTGLPMPFISLGGSSVLFTSVALGLILGISRQMQEKTINQTPQS